MNSTSRKEPEAIGPLVRSSINGIRGNVLTTGNALVGVEVVVFGVCLMVRTHTRKTLKYSGHAKSDL